MPLSICATSTGYPLNQERLLICARKDAAPVLFILGGSLFTNATNSTAGLKKTHYNPNHR